MKRFYKQATPVAVDAGQAIALDGRTIRTPARALLTVPTLALAQAIAAEWEAQSETIDPRTMPLTGLANAAIDQIAPDSTAFALSIARYGESDLLCYRAERPAALVQAQIQAWNPLLDWAERRYAVTFVLGQGIMHVRQPAETERALQEAVAALDPFRLAGLSTLVTMSGSLVCGLAILERAFTTDSVWQAAELDERWQAEQWGEDEEATQRFTRRAAEFADAAGFLALLDE